MLRAIVERGPPPAGRQEGPLRALLLDAQYDEFRGVICHVAVVDGCVRRGERVSLAGAGRSYEVAEVGVMHPEAVSTGVLLSGQVRRSDWRYFKAP